MTLRDVEPVLVADRFPALLTALLDLLRGLSDEEWMRPVHSGEWSVKDLAQHLLGDEINILSGKRDGYSERLGPINSFEELVTMIDRRNDEWVRATRRMSPRVIIELLAKTGEEANAYFAQVDLFAMGGPVNWAGPDPAPVWLDVAREFTERWHHQQHIRQAVGKPGATEAYLFAPVLATFAFALPRAFEHVDAPDGSSVSVTVTGEAGGSWSVVSEKGQWKLYSGRSDRPDAEVRLSEDVAWRLFTKGLTPEGALRHVQLRGDPLLAETTLETVAILA